MIILTDAFGLLIVFTLAYQGFKDYHSHKPSYLIPCLLSFIVFYNTFSFFYFNVINYVKNSFFAGIIIVFCVNIISIFAFKGLIFLIKSQIQKKFTFPIFHPYFLKIIGIFVGMLTGYVFVAGSITALSKHINTDTLTHSFFYRISHKSSEPINQNIKIDNLPSLKKLYSKEAIIQFQFTEQDVLVILKMIRAISNQSANTLLSQANNNQNLASVYQSLIEIYLVSPHSTKYNVSKQQMEAFQAKISNKNKVSPYQKGSKSLSQIIDML